MVRVAICVVMLLGKRLSVAVYLAAAPGLRVRPSGLRHLVLRPVTAVVMLARQMNAVQLVRSNALGFF